MGRSRHLLLNFLQTPPLASRPGLHSAPPLNSWLPEMQPHSKGRCSDCARAQCCSVPDPSPAPSSPPSPVQTILHSSRFSSVRTPVNPGRHLCCPLTSLCTEGEKHNGGGGAEGEGNASSEEAVFLVTVSKVPLGRVCSIKFPKTRDGNLGVTDSEMKTEKVGKRPRGRGGGAGAGLRPRSAPPARTRARCWRYSRAMCWYSRSNPRNNINNNNYNNYNNNKKSR